MKSRYEGIQNYIMHCNESCFFLTLLSVAEEERARCGRSQTIDFLAATRLCMVSGLLKNDFTVLDDCAILRRFTGKWCTKEVVQDVGVVRGNQYTIEKWVRGSKTHFRRRGWDVYKDSQTVKHGYRMCTYKYTFEE